MRCQSCDTASTIEPLNRIMAPTRIKSCDQLLLWSNASMCAKGYYNSYSQKNEEDSQIIVTACVPCQPTEVTCSRGFYPTTCVQSDYNNNCFPCTSPPLPSAAYQYGAGFAYKDCSTLFSTQSLLPLPEIIETCAWYQTPKWGGGYCEIECAAGYVAATQNQPLQCQKCSVLCPPGYRPPRCPGGLPANSEGTTECIPCENPPSSQGAIWTAGCEWTCSQQGYYYSSSANECVACPVAAQKKNCVQNTFFYQGCNGQNVGTCRQCALLLANNSSALVVCTEPHTYLSTEIYFDACACRRCSVPVIGSTFVSKKCTNISNTEFGICQKTCPSSNDFFMVRPCQANADIVCQKCTPPRPGRLLLSKCTPTSDALFAACPWGRACNGTEIHVACPSSSRFQRVAVDGICVCPPASSANSDDAECIPITCPPRMYPDAATGGCSSCGNAPEIRSISNEMGFENACGCLPGYFRRLIKTPNGFSLNCWPCGDLGCDPATQRQWPQCNDGFGKDEPSCQCANYNNATTFSSFFDSSDSNNNKLPQAACAAMTSAKCRPEFAQNTLSSEYPSFPVDRFSFLRLPPRRATVTTTACQNNRRSVVGSAAGPGNTLLVAFSDGSVCIIMTGATASSSPLNLSSILEIPGWRANAVVTAMKPHMALPGLVWIAFTFSGICASSTGGTMDYDGGLWNDNNGCSAIELLMLTSTAANTIILPSSPCALGVCALSVIHPPPFFRRCGTPSRAIAGESMPLCCMPLCGMPKHEKAAGECKKLVTYPAVT